MPDDVARRVYALRACCSFTAYSRETNRGHDTYQISAFDFAESYLPQYEAALREGGPRSFFNTSEAADGVMCSCECRSPESAYNIC